MLSRTAQTLLLFVFLLATAAPPAVAQLLGETNPPCNPIFSPKKLTEKEIIDGCTKWIESGKLSGSMEANFRMMRLPYLSALGLVDDAQRLAEADKIVELEPRLSLARIFRIEIYVKLGAYDRALEDANKLIENMPTDPTGLKTRSAIYSRMGEHDQAIADAQAGLALTPRSPTSYEALANAYMRAGKPDDALGSLSSGLDRVEYKTFLYAARSRFLRSLGRIDEANADYDAALQGAPPDARFRDRIRKASGLQ